jgi:hypothetical protein
MSSETTAIVVSVIAIVIAAVTFFRRGEPVTIQGVTDSLEDAIPLASQLAQVAEIAVQSAEQLKRTGQIQSNDEAFNYALSFVKKWIPATEGIDNEDIIAAINSAVLVASYMADQIPKKPKSMPRVTTTGLL